MKVVAFNGSPRRDGNTSILIDRVLKELKNEGISTEHMHIAGGKLRGCTACYKCFEKLNNKCIIECDIINNCIEKMVEADGIILGSPTYFTDVTAEMKALIDRVGFVAKANDDILKRKVGAAVVSVRRAGGTHVFDTLNHFFSINQMVTVGSDYWNLGMGLDIGDVQKDAEGLHTMELLGQNMAWLLKKINE
ncbi:flavodoxin family protein [Methanococcus maripaludis]|uniref:Multimeric flavodoxin WrbA n=2 Tax=Methanococcus maripaludis TaxID=39152 RepID=A0A7J9PHQ4_METMI|nr:flavodoxin family protein [Methanococcus maripaludis]MBA2862772.1 multimeric flavodoxin WrbA [Methanococcus maripaludis]